MSREARERRVRAAFASAFGGECQALARAPGRVNLIGEHTDYNLGWVLPMAIELSTWAAARTRPDPRIIVRSPAINGSAEWTLDGWSTTSQPHWSSYVAGVETLLRRRGARLAGFELLIESDVPVGGGLSSSAALEVSTALALAHLSGEPLATAELIDLCRAAEHEFAGTPCGIMDQTVSLLGQAGCALLLDCRSRAVRPVPLRLDGHVFLVVDSGVRHELASSAYRERQEQCRVAVAYFRKGNPAIQSLRDVTPDTVRAHAQQMNPLAFARALHVAGENARTLAAAAALERGDLRAAGALMNESHRSLRDDYEVSCRELDELSDTLRNVPGVLGARMTGGGFGGCVLALLAASQVASAVQAVERAHPRAGRPRVLHAAAGGAVL